MGTLNIYLETIYWGKCLHFSFLPVCVGDTAIHLFLWCVRLWPWFAYISFLGLGTHYLWLGSISKVLLWVLFLTGLSGGQYELVRSIRVLSVFFRVGKIVRPYRLMSGLRLSGHASSAGFTFTVGGFEGCLGKCRGSNIPIQWNQRKSGGADLASDGLVPTTL